MYKEIKLSPGQNIRYIGKGFPGFIKELPYMTFVSYHNSQHCLVNYNEIRVIVSSRFTIAVS